MNKAIEHPYILHQESARIVETSTAPHGQEYYCLCCNPPSRMILKEGPQKTKHAAHHPSDRRPDTRGGESWLHWTAVQMIKHSFERCLESGKNFTLWGQCPWGHTLFRRDLLASGYHQVQAEDAAVIKHVRPDLTFRANDGRLLFVEVVYSHPIENDTLKRYQAFGRPVVVWHITTPDDLKRLNTGGDPLLHIEPAVHVMVECKSCRRRKERKRAQQQELEKEVERSRQWWAQAYEWQERQLEGEVLNESPDYMNSIINRKEVQAWASRARRPEEKEPQDGWVKGIDAIWPDDGW